MPGKQYAMFELLDHRVSYDLDLSCVKKSFNFAFYTSALTPGDEYKDAQSGDSRTEIDMTEANRSAYHFTAHKAYDRGGQLIMGTGGTIQIYNPNQRFLIENDSTYDRNKLYGPGEYIDTRQPFHVEITFTRDVVRLQLSQENRIIFKEDGGEYLNSLLPELEGRRHTPVISLWIGDLWWLDAQLPTCDDENSIIDVKASISNIRFDSLTQHQDNTCVTVCPYCGHTLP